MTRKNYRVICYYKDDAYSTEVYASVVNARSASEIKAYFDSTDFYYEVVDVVECKTIEEVRKAGSILMDGVRIYADDINYGTILTAVNVLCFLSDF